MGIVGAGRSCKSYDVKDQRKEGPVGPEMKGHRGRQRLGKPTGSRLRGRREGKGLDGKNPANVPHDGMTQAAARGASWGSYNLGRQG